MKTILVVEDNKDYQDLLVRRLTKEGYTTTTADNGEKAEEILKKAKIDLILLDLLMPEEDGVSFYYKLTHILKKDIPVIVLTNVTDAAGFGKDVKDVLIKANVSMDEVVEKVGQYLR